MIRNLILLTVFPLLTGCSSNGGSLPHHPKLTLSQLARSEDSDSQLFTSYHPQGPCRWNQGWPWKLDLTGVSWDIDTTVTAITPRHVVMADHFKRSAGKQVTFHDRDGRMHTRILLKSTRLRDHGLKCDVAVGLLDKPLPPSIRHYPLLEPRNDFSGSLVGALALITEQDRRLFFHRISWVRGNVIGFQFDRDLQDFRRKPLISGDSGNPSFILARGELVLIETHSTGGPGSGPFYGSKTLIEATRKAVAALDPSYQLRTLALDAIVIEDARIGRKSLTLPKPATPQPQGQPQPQPQPRPPNTPRPRVVTPPS